MREMVTYLNFDGNAREAMQFYARCLGGELTLMPFSEAKVDVPPGAQNRTIHAKLMKGSCVLMASDTMPGTPFQRGNNFHICLQCESLTETEQLFSSLGENGKVTMPLQDTFWGARFGMIVDQFGVSWMFNFEKPKP
ncbi:MAG TPA: VOC family protein [Terriglobia bacterium]|nr:VOC family protein [Terriglobia bacterium]